ncbi:MAG TPA: hypothetical protein VF815_14790 [Myxococcaceae bacterium]|jgi:hypothetical protein
MLKMRWSTLAVALVLASQTACYTTKILSNREPDTRSRTYTDRQWFTIGGLVPLSEAAGRECEHGLSSAESQLSGTDILINIGLAVAGGLAGSAACADESTEERASCVTLGTTLVPFLIGSRTVEYSCAAAPASGPAWAPANPTPPATPSAPPPPPASTPNP